MKVNNKKIVRFGMIVSVMSVLFGFICITGLLDQVRDLWSLIAQREPAEKFVILGFLGMILFIFNSKKVASWYIKKALANTGKKNIQRLAPRPKPVIQHQSPRTREDKVSMNVINSQGECVERKRFKVVAGSKKRSPAQRKHQVKRPLNEYTVWPNNDEVQVRIDTVEQLIKDQGMVPTFSRDKKL